MADIAPDNQEDARKEPVDTGDILASAEPKYRKIRDSLIKLDPNFGKRLAAVYEGIIVGMQNKRNPDRIAQVSHSARELSGILPKYFKGLPVPELNQKDDAHRELVKGILSVHPERNALPEYLKDTFADAWMEVHRCLVKHSKHDDLKKKEIAETASQEQEFEANLWKFSDLLYEVVVDVPFFDSLPEIDALLQLPNPTDDDFVKLSKLISQPQHRRYFFEKCNKPEWLELLNKRKAFSAPQEPLKEGGYIRFTIWPESQYLARAADRKPKEVYDIIKPLNSENQSVIDDFLDAALNSSVEYAKEYVGLIEKHAWIQNPYNLRLPDKIADLMEKLADAGETEHALRLARVLFDIKGGQPRTTAADGVDPAYIMQPDAKPYFDEWRFGEILKNKTSKISAKSPTELFDIYIHKLGKAIELEKRGGGEDFNEYSHIWRPNLLQSRRKMEDAKNILIDGIVDLIEQNISNDEVFKKIVVAIKKLPQGIFRRIEMLIYGLNPDPFIKEAEEILVNEKIVVASNLRREYLPLLRKAFSKISSTGQQAIIKVIEKGPGFKKLDYLTEAQFASLLPTWQALYFGEIKEFLPEEQRKKYEESLSLYGKPEQDDGEVKMSEGGKSPIASKELASFDTEKTVEYFGEYEEPEDFLAGHSSAGLGMTFAGITKENPEKYVSQSALFLDQKVRPIYIYHFLNGLKEALKQEKCFSWEPIIELCHSIIQTHPSDLAKPASDREQGWRSVYFAIVDLLGEAMGSKKCEIPLQFREKIWSIISSLSEHPEPTVQDEKRDQQGGLDPMTLAINTVRGETMHAVVNYGLWIARNQKDLDKQVMKMPPEMEALLDKHLDPKLDPSLAIRSVYGWRLPNIFYLNRKWVEDNKEKIFPNQAEERPLLLAALEGYSANSVYYDIFDVLKDVYKKAISLFGTAEKNHGYRASDIDERLPQHLMIVYTQDLKHDDLIKYFFSTAPVKARAQAISFVGHMILKELPGYQNKEAITKRMLQLWDARLNAHIAEVEELQEFGWWFARSPFAHEDTLDRTIKTLRLTKGIIDVPYEIVETLGGYAPQYPLETITILDLLARANREFNDFSYKKEEYRAILKSIKGSGNQEAIKIADSLINFIGSKGVMDFRELLNS